MGEGGLISLPKINVVLDDETVTLSFSEFGTFPLSFYRNEILKCLSPSEEKAAGEGMPKGTQAPIN